MAVPKRKTSKAKRNSRQSANMKKSLPGISICPQCHQPKLPHRDRRGGIRVHNKQQKIITKELFSNSSFCVLRRERVEILRDK